MLAGARNLVFAATIVMAGLFAVMLTDRLDRFFHLPPLHDHFVLDVPDPWSLIEAASGYTESLVGVAVMIWLVGRMVRHASK